MTALLNYIKTALLMLFQEGINGEGVTKLEFGGVFRALRQRAGLSQEEMAEKLFVNQSDISKFENDKKTPDLPTFLRIAQVTNAPEVVVAFLYGMDGISILQNLSTLVTG